MRHTPPGTRIHALTRPQDGQAVLIVQDDGPGIPAELRQRVFERFVRGGGDGGRGSGLGLAIVNAVAESHGGTVELDAQRASGTRFVIRLPAVSDGEDPEPQAGDETVAQTSTTTGSTIGRRRSRS